MPLLAWRLELSRLCRVRRRPALQWMRLRPPASAAEKCLSPGGLHPSPKRTLTLRHRQRSMSRPWPRGNQGEPTQTVGHRRRLLPALRVGWTLTLTVSRPSSTARSPTSPGGDTSHHQARRCRKCECILTAVSRQRSAGDDRGPQTPTAIGGCIPAASSGLGGGEEVTRASAVGALESLVDQFTPAPTRLSRSLTTRQPHSRVRHSISSSTSTERWRGRPRQASVGGRRGRAEARGNRAAGSGDRGVDEVEAREKAEEGSWIRCGQRQSVQWNSRRRRRRRS